jgi:hypothetical protein
VKGIGIWKRGRGGRERERGKGRRKGRRKLGEGIRERERKRKKGGEGECWESWEGDGRVRGRWHVKGDKEGGGRDFSTFL